MAIWTTCWEYLNQYYRSEIKIPSTIFSDNILTGKVPEKLANLRTCWSLVSLASPLFQAEPSQLCCLWRSQQSRLWKFQLLLGYGRQNIAGRIVGPGYSSWGWILIRSQSQNKDPENLKNQGLPMYLLVTNKQTDSWKWWFFVTYRHTDSAL